ncbi:MCE family protein [Nocardioides sp. BGMRC 2183]|nr:MCE family protein [Nocardioides sp. BGMRC 2183]
MSDLLFTGSRLSPRALRLRLAAAGLVGAVLLGLLTLVLGLQTLGVLSDDARVEVRLPTVGDTLAINSDVKYQGMRVGRVVAVDPGVGDPEGPSAEVLVDADHALAIPATVRARVLPGTLFGNEYVDLVTDTDSSARRGAGVVPASSKVGAGDHLTDGDVVAADTSAATLRLMDTFEATQRLLAAVDPGQWDTALSELARAFDGRGEDLHQLIRDGNGYLSRWAALEPQVMEDLGLVADNADLLADIEPELVTALEDSLPLARTVVRHEQDLRTLMTGTSGLLDGPEGITAFLAAHDTETARLLADTAATLQVFADRHPAFEALLGKAPQVLRNGAAAVQDGRIQMEGVLAPQLLDPYDAEDCPRYGNLAGPNCPGGR